MNDLYPLSKKEREMCFHHSAEILKIPFEIIEKDYWVVWILERLFSLKDLKSHLTFKGGTSLSKIYGVIHRFSEDIDLSIEKEFLGYSTDLENAPSKKKQRNILDNLSKTCADYVQTDLLNQLQNSIFSKLGNENWTIFPDAEDPDAQTLLFEYPSKALKNGYIRPLVKIEIGARSEHWPVSEHKLQSYAKEALGEAVYEPEIWIRVLNAERTFWEKATILHQYAHLPEGKKLPPRISRHFYDFYRLLNSRIKENALKQTNLLERVASHKSIYFASNWANYSAARKSTLKLSPPSRIQAELEKDYAQMRLMFFREIPEWGLILETIEKFENEFNSISD